ncbi:Type I inositol 1,4,5-trisphosphate 5-phosphatase 1 [Platanthera guangdongensis]|uniref:Type I inositol 1,4,5-trisphosphate 5-phosphatase 1 n=1 Tax=Platanthera guangdongensis TaxID=2320717 RepID=A0ABR2M290_9ASPA
MRQIWSTTKKQGEISWSKAIFKKLLHLNTKKADFSADEGDSNADSDEEDEEDEEQDDIPEGHFGKLRRSNSETLRSHYIDSKDVRICIGTWNVGGKVPHCDLDIEEWIDTNEPADIYVLGMQEIVPLNAGNIFGPEHSSPVPRWEALIREILNKVRKTKPKYKCYTGPTSPSRLKPSDDFPAIVEELLYETDTDSDNGRIHPLNEVQNITDDFINDEISNFPSMKRLNRCHGFSLMDCDAIPETSHQKILTKTLSSSERIGLAWPEQPLDLLAKCALDSPKSFRSKSLKTYRSVKSAIGDHKESVDFGSISKFDLYAPLRRKKISSFVRIISKQMVGIYISIWVRRSLQKHIQNLKVSTVGVGAMGYIGNKGSISVSMSIYQTQFCFICTHLSSGEKNGDELRRKADVQEIHRRTRFIGLPNSIKNHEKIFWFGDLNYRLNLPYKSVHNLISAKKWSELFEKDQLKQEFRKGGLFDGWKEGIINFPPTYKYGFNSENYIEEDSKSGRRSPAWCDRILAFGNGIKLMSYRRSDLKVSDHRPVTATFLSEVEIFSHRKLQKALSLTDAEIDEGKIIEDIDFAVGMGGLMLAEEISQWEHLKAS